VGLCVSSVHPTTLEIVKEIRIIRLLPEVANKMFSSERHLSD